MTTPAPQPAPTPTGLLLIDKPLGRTSMDVCRVVRRRLVLAGAPKRVKVGHGGTLDPLATGLLVILVGKATPLCERIMLGTKVYDADVDLGAFSSTDDAEGQRTEVHVDTPPSIEAVRAACAALTGTILQTPPAYSAMKVNGRRAYDLARAGHDVKLAPRPVRIDAIEVLRYAWPIVTLRVTCGKGTYIRSLARDLGGLLGTGGTLASLRRTRIGRFDVAQARTIGQLPETLVQGDLMVAIVEGG